MSYTETIKECITSGRLIKMTASGPINRTDTYTKLVLTAKESFFQLARYRDAKVYHENFAVADEALACMLPYADAYKQWDIALDDETVKILLNKKKHAKILRQPNRQTRTRSASHDECKNYEIKPGQPVDYLVKLGVMNPAGQVYANKQKKFRQINRFLETISKIADTLPKEARIMDVGCGKAYLTFALYAFLCEKGLRPHMTGIDIKLDVVSNNNQIARELGFEGLSFDCRDIKDLVAMPHGPGQAMPDSAKSNTLRQEPSAYSANRPGMDMVVSLHACDTATDYAICYAIQQQSKWILCAPCCQHELYGQIQNDDMHFLLKHGILKEKFAALLTDALRALTLEAVGYRCDAIEFVDPEHTSKNLLLRAVRTSQRLSHAKVDHIRHMMEQYALNPTLYRLLAFTDL